MTGDKPINAVSLVDYDDSDSDSNSELNGLDSTPNLGLDKLSRIHKAIHTANGLDLGIKTKTKASHDTGKEKKKFVNATVPTFDKAKKYNVQVDLNDVNPPFEFGDRGQRWRQIKLKAFSEQLSTFGALENIVYDKYPNFIKLKRKCRYAKDDVDKLLNQYATLWDVGYILIELEYLSTPANDTCKVLDKANEFLKIRFS